MLPCFCGGQRAERNQSFVPPPWYICMPVQEAAKPPWALTLTAPKAKAEAMAVEESLPIMFVLEGGFHRMRRPKS